MTTLHPAPPRRSSGDFPSVPFAPRPMGVREQEGRGQRVGARERGVSVGGRAHRARACRVSVRGSLSRCRASCFCCNCCRIPARRTVGRRKTAKAKATSDRAVHAPRIDGCEESDRGCWRAEQKWRAFGVVLGDREPGCSSLVRPGGSAGQYGRPVRPPTQRFSRHLAQEGSRARPCTRVRKGQGRSRLKTRRGQQPFAVIRCRLDGVLPPSV